MEMKAFAIRFQNGDQSNASCYLRGQWKKVAVESNRLECDGCPRSIHTICQYIWLLYGGVGGGGVVRRQHYGSHALAERPFLRISLCCVAERTVSTRDRLMESATQSLMQFTRYID